MDEMIDEADEFLREAAWEFRKTMFTKADAHHGNAPLWHGWVIYDAYVAGALAERKRAAALSTPLASKGGTDAA